MDHQTGFSFVDIVEDAVQRAGGQDVTAATIISARRSLYTLTEEWASQRLNTWRVRSEVFGSATTASATVQLPDRVDDILDVSVIRSSGSETTMKRMSATEYAQITNKATTGQPSSWWLDRSVRPVLYQYPTGPAQLAIWYVERPEAFGPYTDVTSGIPGRWLRAMVLGLAYDLAAKAPQFGGVYDEALLQRLQQDYRRALALAQDNDRERKPYVYRIRRT